MISCRSLDSIIQSWDVANKQGEENDYSACTTWLVHENKYYLIHVLRGRFDFPTLRTKVTELAKVHKASQILIEDAGIGTALIQNSRRRNCQLFRSSRSMTRKPECPYSPASSRVVRCSSPMRPHGLQISKPNFFAFPSGRHDDQVDSISQALGHKSRSHWTHASLEGYGNLMNALTQDAIFGRLAGRPW